MDNRISEPDEFGRVAVAMGGYAAEREISLNSGRAVLAALQRRGVDAVAVELDRLMLQPLMDQNFDRVFNMVHGRGGEDGVLQGALQAIDLPYTGSGVLGSALSMDKRRSKLCWISAALPTPAWCLLRTDEDIDRCASELGYPMIVKPALEGSSIGMSKVANSDELRSAWDLAAESGCDVFAEAWVEGNEYTAGFLGDTALPLIRLETPNAFYDYDAKYCATTTQYHCPCGLSDTHEQQLQELALQAYRTVNASGWGRVDLFMDQSQNPWLIEINTVPGMTDHSLVPMAAKAAGIEFDELVWRILETSINNDR